LNASAELARLPEWIGRVEVLDDTAMPGPIAALSALLDRDDPAPRMGDPVPPLAHWLYFLPMHRQSETGPDGHPRRGGFLPPVPLPRRMWAGSRLEWHKPLSVGTPIRRTSRIADVKLKEGRSGPLVFVTVRHEVGDAGGIAIVDEHDIVYRNETGQAVSAPVPAPTNETWSRVIHPDPVLLFRYSAATANGHRIHYDHPYVTRVEGYPGLVVHGPLIATLLIDLLRRSLPGVALRTFAFRAVRPLFDTAPFTVCGLPDAASTSAQLWSRDAQGAVTMQAVAAWA
jgi:3-methylfumaryl-CoA hydratase